MAVIDEVITAVLPVGEDLAGASEVVSGAELILPEFFSCAPAMPQAAIHKQSAKVIRRETAATTTGNVNFIAIPLLPGELACANKL
jgi:hypothetical protein